MLYSLRQFMHTCFDGYLNATLSAGKVGGADECSASDSEGPGP